MATKHDDRTTFLTHLRQSGLVSSADIPQVEEIAAEVEHGKSLARQLVERGVLTRFQAEMVYRGRTEGFVLGQYRVLDRIGRGGMGRVFKAEHQTMHRIVAIKLLSSRLTKTVRARQMFEREVRAAARLIHPNIVTAYDANQSADRHYLVMEYVDGPNLQELVKERGPIPVGRACEFIRQAALGLQHAHENGMVHRDIKPANLLVQHDAGGGYTVKILDFGLARLHEPDENLRTTGDSLPPAEQQVMGTPDYLSPEQARNLHSVDIRSDLYSLGCTLYFLLTGRVPFPGGSPLEKLVRHASDEPTPISQLRGDVPTSVVGIVNRLMAKKPAQRFTTPAEVALALAPFADVGDESIPTVPLASLEVGAVSDECPWANIFDDEDRLGVNSTVPADLSMTPIPASVRIRKSQKTFVVAGESKSNRWARPLIIAAAGLFGFLLGVALLLLWMR